MTKRRTGLPSLSYMGVEASTPPQLVMHTRAPTTKDYANFNIGTVWIYDTTPQQIWMLTNKDNHLSTWVELTGGGGIAMTNGTAGQVLVGGGLAATWANISTSDNTITVTEGDNTLDIKLTAGATGVTTVNGGTNITCVNPGGPVVTVNLDSDPTLAGDLGIGQSITAGTTITSGTTMIAGTGFTCNNGDIVASTGDIISTLGGFEGVDALFSSLGRGVVQSSNIGYLSSSEGTDGQVLISSSTGAPAWSTLTEGAGINIANADNNITISSTVVGDITTVNGGTNITCDSPGGPVVTVNLDDPITLVSLGRGVVQTDAGGVLSSSEGTNGQILISSTTGAPAWATITAGADIKIVNTGNHITISSTGGRMPEGWFQRVGSGGHKITNIAYGDGHYVATRYFQDLVHHRGYIYVNTIKDKPPIDWTSVTVEGSDYLNGIVYGNGIWVAGCYLGYVYTAANPLGPWVQRTFLNNQLSNIEYGGGYYVGSHSSYTKVDTFSVTMNPTGAWILVPSTFSPLLPSPEGVMDIVYGGGIWLAVGMYGHMATAVNPMGPWVARANSFGTTHINAVAYGNGYWAAAGDSGKIAYSIDPTSGVWTQVENSFGTSSINTVRYGGGTWFFGGASSNNMYVVGNPDDVLQQGSYVFRDSINTITASAYGPDDGYWVCCGEIGEISTCNNL